MQRLLGGSTAECVAPDSAKRLDLTSPALQGMLRTTFESMDATRVLSLWEAIAQEPTLARLAGNITLDGIVCAQPITRLKAMHTLFDALAASPAEERQRATAAFVTLAARHAEFQGQLRRQLTQGGDPEIRALLDGLAPKTPDQLDAVLAGAYDIKAGNMQGLMVMPDAYPDNVLAPGVSALAETLAAALTDEIEPAQAAALQAALADKALGALALKVLAGATLGLVADVDRRHMQTSDPLDAPISF
ncbi:MAG: hypothetical protein ACK46X_15805, partial [Candidatus Sericytochromatia bacterium]